ncbi:MAG: Ig domain-containing protein [Lachnospiraceae bacterium]|nr:Ig domain-containing protein [Lachnospiraceae bacterium]
MESASVAVGKSFTLKATVLPASAASSVSWKSSNANIASVSQKGVVKAKKAGSATITVASKDGKKKAVCKITVKVPVKSVKLNKSKATIRQGESLSLKATISPSTETTKTVSWKSSDAKIASVSKTGVVKGKKAGSVTIKAVTMDGKKTASCSVKVR